MKARVRRSKSTQAIQTIMGAKRSLGDEVRLTENQINDRFAFIQLEHRCLSLEKDYTTLRQKLVALLLPEQIDAAKTCGVTPEVYALEWIQLYKDKLREKAPAYTEYVQGIRSFDNGSL